MVARCATCGGPRGDPGLAICLDCGVGMERAGLPELHQALRVLSAWLVRAGEVLAALAPDDPRLPKAAAQLGRRQKTYAWLEERRDTLESDGLELRFPFAVRWARTQGRLEVRDAFSGEWLEVDASRCPEWWRRRATRA